MDTLYFQGIRVAEALQSKTKNYESFWLFATYIGDPKAAFLLVFPPVFYLHRRTGIAIIWVAAISEWLNLVFKWLLFGERPYWWIGQSGLFVKNSASVQQFQSTCETGPGSPSGHAMVTAAVWWVVTSSLASFLHSGSGSKILFAIPYLFYALLLGAVGLSRIFILAHFPHQIISGLLAGVTLGVFLNRKLPERCPQFFLLCSSMAMLLGALIMHAGLEKVGINLSWSITLAKRWCSKPEWVCMDTAPFSSLSRDAGALFGLGLVQFWKPEGWALSWGPKSLCLALSSLTLYHVNRFPLPTTPSLLFYSLFFLRYTIVPLVVMVLIPGFVQLFTAKPKRD
ncbi:glucose-6-phosphatase 3 [Trichomycterus rosablanca]|uniref:glucose-6-phosphatase 3 n=1 Tax=Trichomycterus rosablanca TaxID=2290929 RepID=UPI002F35098C